MFTFTYNRIKKKIILFIIRRFIGHFISNTLDMNSIEINDSGFKISELHIDPDVFEPIHDVLELKNGIITDLMISIPWRNILTKSSILNIDKINITFDWNVKEEINVNELAKTILCEALNVSKYENYLEQSLYEDEPYLIEGNENTRDKHYGLDYIRKTIQTVAENIKLNVNLIDCRINFPNGNHLNVQIHGANIIKSENDNNKNIDSKDIDSDIDNKDIDDDDIDSKDIDSEDIDSKNIDDDDDIDDDDIDDDNECIKKSVKIDNIIILVNDNELLSVQNPIVDVWTKNKCIDEHDIHIYGIKSNIEYVNVYLNQLLLNNVLNIIKELTSGIKKDNNNVAKPYQIDLDLNIDKWKFLLEKDKSNHICSVSNNISFILENRPTWGGFKQKNSLLSVNEAFPLEASILPNEDSIMTSVYSSITRQITRFKLSIFDWETYELLNDTKVCLIRPYQKDLNQMEISFDGGMYDKVNISLCPVLLTIDLNIIKRYFDIIETFKILEGNKSKSIFKQKTLCAINCQLCQIIVKIPISKTIQALNKTDGFYEESFFIDLYDLILLVKTSSFDVTCQKALGNLLEKDKIINFLSAKGSKEKPIVFSMTNNQLFEEKNMNKHIKWIKEEQMDMGKHKIYVNKIVDDIDVLNRDIMRQSKSILKLHLREIAVYLNYQYFNIIRNLISELGAWDSPFISNESFYMLFNIAVNSLSVNITHPKFCYTILGERINSIIALNFLTNHKYVYSQIYDAYLYNNDTKKIILRKDNSQYFAKIVFDQLIKKERTDINSATYKLLSKLRAKSNLSFEIGKIMMNTNQKEFCKHDAESNFWVSNFVEFFKKNSVKDDDGIKTKIYVNISQLINTHKIWNIPTMLQLQVNNLQFTNELEPICGITLEYFTVELLMDKWEISVLQNQNLNIIWKDKQLEINNEKCIVELCSDTIVILKGIITEANKKIDKLSTSIIDLDFDWESEDDSDMEIVGHSIRDTNCNYRQLKQVEELISEAIRPIKHDSNSFGTMSIYKLNKYDINDSGSYEKMHSINYTSKAYKDNQYVIVKDFNIDVRLYSGLDTNNTRNNSAIISVRLDKINVIYYKSEDETNSKLFCMIRNILIEMISSKTIDILKPDITNIKSWALISSEETALINSILSLNDKRRVTHFMDWSNDFGLVINIDDLGDDKFVHDYLINMHPLTFNLNQEAINFAIEFNDNQKNYDKYFILEGDYVKIESTEEIVTVIRPIDTSINFNIKPIKIMINYKSSIFDFNWNKNATILNFVNLDETTLKFKEYTTYADNYDMLGKNILTHYEKEVKNSNSLNIITGLSPVKTVVKIGSGIVNLIIIPSREGFQNSRWKYGFKKGMSHFKKSTLSELANIGYKIVNVADKIINNRDETITMTIPSDEYTAGNLSKVVLNLAKCGVRSGKNSMLKLKDDLSGKNEKEKMQELLRELEDE